MSDQRHPSSPSGGDPTFLTPLLRDREFAVEYADTLARMGLVDDLVRAREARGATQTAVALLMGVSQPTVSGFENEASDPRLSTLQRYARAVGKRVVVTLVTDSESEPSLLPEHPAKAGAPDEPKEDRPAANPTRRALAQLPQGPRVE